MVNLDFRTDRLVAVSLLMICLGMQFGCAAPLFEQINPAIIDSNSDAILFAKFSDVSPDPIKPVWSIRPKQSRNRFFLTCSKKIKPVLYPSKEMIINPFYNEPEQQKLILDDCSYLAVKTSPKTYILEYRTNRETLFTREFTVQSGKLLYLGNHLPEEKLQITRKELLSTKYIYTYKTMEIADTFSEDVKWLIQKHPELGEFIKNNTLKIPVGENK